MKCSPATQSSNLMTEIDKVICMDIAVYVFYMYLYAYLIHTYNTYIYNTYIYIFTYSFGYLVLKGDSLDCILYFEVPYHCIVINIRLFIYTEKFV